MSLVEFYRIDENNPGDYYSNPCRYFFSGNTTIKVDIDNIKKTTWHPHDTIIVGGGGLIGNENFEELMERLSTHPEELLLRDILDVKIKRISDENQEIITKFKEKVQKATVQVLSEMDRTIGPRILWGVGFNSRDTNEDLSLKDYPGYLKNYHLVGVRDWNVGYRWVPCASCMHPAFDKQYEIINKVVWFEHKKRLIDNKFFDAIPNPRMVNTGQNLEQIIEFLGTAETVITNSYHGVYWATLLGKKVVCVPWGSKFNMFKHPPTMATMKNWQDMIEEAVAYPDALTECRTANISFYEEVKRTILQVTKNKNLLDDLTAGNKE